jgi:predicted permease
MHEESNKTIESPQSQWWLAKNGVAEVPLSHQEICDALQSNKISLADYVYSSDTKEWKPLSAWNTFEPGNVDAALQSPPAPPLESYPTDPLVTNPRLPAMANWICIYTLLVSPWLWWFYVVSDLTSGLTFVENAPLAGMEALAMFVGMLTSLFITVALFIGGMRLRALRRSGTTIIILSIVVAVAVQVLMLFGVLLLLAMSDPIHYATKTVAVELIDFLAVIVGLCEAAFMVTALLWLRRNERSLPLT